MVHIFRKKQYSYGNTQTKIKNMFCFSFLTSSPWWQSEGESGGLDMQNVAVKGRGGGYSWRQHIWKRVAQEPNNTVPNDEMIEWTLVKDYSPRSLATAEKEKEQRRIYLCLQHSNNQTFKQHIRRRSRCCGAPSWGSCSRRLGWESQVMTFSIAALYWLLYYFNTWVF